MRSLAKLNGPDLESSNEFTFPNVWEREDQAEFSRITIGAREKEIPLILELCRNMDGPFCVLYVLVGSRLGRATGRYQNHEPLSFDELELFLYTFQEFFEQDGRHHLWVMSLSGEGQFIFDNHNILYGYGDIDEYQKYLSTLGFVSGNISIPSTHTHNYHPEFDMSEDELFDYWQWLHSPLQPGDEV